MDADRDGVVDSDDWCLGTPKGVRVGPDGCPIGSSAGTGAPCSAAGYLAGRDADGDGVQDSEDFCLDSPRGARVGPDGCVAWEVGTRSSCDGPVKEGDADGDGVMDASDRCPGTPRGAKVDSRGCPVPTVKDSDGDGVEDSDDECPGTAKGAPVDRYGCVIVARVVLKGVSFPTGSAVLRTEAHEILRNVASAMKRNDDLVVEIGGHTDSQGSDERNMALSERRARAVRDFLMKEGIGGDRLIVKGYGETKPVDTNDTAAGRANNRRVEFKVLED